MEVSQTCPRRMSVSPRQALGFWKLVRGKYAARVAAETNIGLEPDPRLLKHSQTIAQLTRCCVASDWWLDLRRSYTIGDSPQDVEAARRFGGTGCLVKTGWAAEDKFLDKARPSAAFIGDSITEAVEWVVGREQKNGEQRRTRQWDGAEDFENP